MRNQNKSINPEYSKLSKLITTKCSENKKINRDLLEIAGEIKQQNSELEEQLSQIKNLYRDKISFDEVKEKQFKILEEELDRYKSNFIYNAIQKRIFQELIGLSDRIEDLLNLANSEISKEDIIQHISSLSKQLNQILINQGIEKIVPKTKKFDPKYQEAIDKVNTDKQEEDQLINKVLKEGFIYDQKIIRPQKVIIKKYTN